MSSYYELLKHPLWQKKRLEKLNAANFECEDCGGGEKTLHVHHSNEEIQFRVGSYEIAQGIADWWGLTPKIILDNLNDGQICGEVLLKLVVIHGSPLKPWLVRYAKQKSNA